MTKIEVILKSENQQSTVKIEVGELVSYIFNEEELIHQKGSPGWEKSDTEMFPIIGPLKTSQYKVSTTKGIVIQDQHGFLRELNYDLNHRESHKAVFKKI